ncbi:glycoside hydrolase family 13 protein [Lachnobacterium bovis]|uniref:Glycosidase n=1 Tax=Lachnobacterium bovis TaxID=140626 RepID=A0A1H9PDS4_9FIRM|nr:glycoside hydrolase family 13 protein [Lachnobacterium bovis]SER45713.1 Glycosidase [Lachnobacterium bovis]
MNQFAILHMSDSKYCYAVNKDEIVIRLRTSKEDELDVFLLYGPKYEFQSKRYKAKMKVKYEDKLYRYYEKRIKLSDLRLAYIFEIYENGERFYFCEDGIVVDYDFENAFYNFYQMPYINENDRIKVVEWMQGAVFYQIFVDRFNMGNLKKDKSYIDMKWGDKPTPKNFAGGDIRGIIDKLDYLENLGITAIYLTPIFLSISNHKYDIIDYKKIDPMFGDIEDLKELVHKAHEKNIHIVLDAVFNHCSMNLYQFQDVIEKGKKSKYYDWFIIDGDFPEPEKGNYECFASCNYMPKLNTANLQVQEFLLDIAVYWIRECDIDGWRLDVSDEVSHDFWRQFRKAVKKEKENCVIIGENWHDAYAYLMGDQYDSIMNYAFTKACLDYLAKDKLDAKGMANKLNEILMRNNSLINSMMLNLIDSHDTFRFFTEVKCNKKKQLCALALSVFFPGAVCVYYGTEICMEGGYDPDSRRCFDWNEENWDKEFLEKFKALLKLKKFEEIRFGTVKIYEKNCLLIVERIYKNNKIRLEINMENKVINGIEPFNYRVLRKGDYNEEKSSCYNAS